MSKILRVIVEVRVPEQTDLTEKLLARRVTEALPARLKLIEEYNHHSTGVFRKVYATATVKSFSKFLASQRVKDGDPVLSLKRRIRIALEESGS